MIIDFDESNLKENNPDIVKQLANDIIVIFLDNRYNELYEHFLNIKSFIIDDNPHKTLKITFETNCVEATNNAHILFSSVDAKARIGIFVKNMREKGYKKPRFEQVSCTEDKYIFTFGIDL